MNPYDQIDTNRKNPGNFSVPGPTMQLDEHLAPIWQDAYYLATKYVISLVSGNKPNPNVIFTFNVLSAGNPPFTCSAMANFVTECMAVYWKALRDQGGNSHNEALVRSVIEKMGEAYCLAIVSADDNLRNMVGNNQNLINEVMGAVDWYKNTVANATQSGGWGGSNNGWGSNNNNNNGGWGSNNNNGWSSSSNNGWNDNSGNNGWGSDDMTQVNGWESTVDDSNWGTSNNSNQSSWGNLGGGWDTPNTNNTQKENNMLEEKDMDPIDAAIAAALRAAQGESQPKEETPAPVIEEPAEEPVKSWEGDWGGDWRNDFSGDELALELDGVEDAVIEVDNLVGDVVSSFIEGTCALKGFTYDDEAEYVEKVIDIFGMVPDSAKGVKVNGLNFIVIPDHEAANYTHLLHQHEAFSLTKAIPIKGLAPWYIVNQDGELKSIMLDISSHDVYYSSADEVEVDHLIKTMLANQEDDDTFVEIEGVGDIASVYIEDNYRTTAEVEHIAKTSLEENKVGAVLVQATKTIAVMPVLHTLTEFGELTNLDKLQRVHHALEENLRAQRIFERAVVKRFNVAIRNLFRIKELPETYSELLVLLKSDGSQLGLVQEELQGWTEQMLKSIVVTQDKTDFRFVSIGYTSDFFYCPAIKSFDEIIGATTTATGYRLPAMVLENINLEANITRPLHLLTDSGVVATIHGLMHGWIYITAEEML